MTEKTEKKRSETKSVTWRMPTWVAEQCTGDWTAMREVLDEWAETGEELEVELPEETISVCLRVNENTLAKLEKEAKRISKFSRRKWTAGKVARAIYEQSMTGNEE